MHVQCAECEKKYDDAKCWTICPHPSLDGPPPKKLEVRRQGLPNPSALLLKAEDDSRKLAKFLASHCPSGWGFAFLMFQFNGPECTWISNANRKDMVKMLRELAVRLERDEAGGPVAPTTTTLEAQNGLQAMRTTDRARPCPRDT